MPNPEQGCCLKCFVRDKQCTVIVHLDHLLMNCKDASTIVGVIEALSEELVSGYDARHVRSLREFDHYADVYR